jgi:hypothetical protein
VGGVSQCQELQDHDTGHSQAERELVDELDLDGEGTIILEHCHKTFYDNPSLWYFKFVSVEGQWREIFGLGFFMDPLYSILGPDFEAERISIFFVFAKALRVLR